MNRYAVDNVNAQQVGEIDHCCDYGDAVKNTALPANFGDSKEEETDGDSKSDDAEVDEDSVRKHALSQISRMILYMVWEHVP
jgi:hypothetical protein